MAEIFISYRLQDAPQTVASVYNFVAEAFGPATIFIDTARHTGIDNFRQQIEPNVQNARIMLVIVGKEWFGSVSNINNRLEKDDDVVHLEVSRGLELARQGHLAIIPILIDDTPMPTSQQLPSDLSSFAQQNAERLRTNPRYLAQDIINLLNAISEREIPRRIAGLINKPPERLRAFPNIGLIFTNPDEMLASTTTPAASIQPSDRNKSIVIVAPSSSRQQAMELAASFEEKDILATIVRDPSPYLTSARAILVILSPATIDDPAIATAKNIQNITLIPVLTEPMTIPQGSWTATPFVLTNITSNQIAASFVKGDTRSPLTPSTKQVTPPTKQAQSSTQRSTRTDWQTIGLGFLMLMAAIILPTETQACTTDGFGQQFCTTTIYTYNGVNASLAKGLLFFAAVLCIGGGIYFLRRHQSNSEE